jgi:hypothetical protein
MPYVYTGRGFAAAGLEVPYEANLNNVGSLVWLEQLMVS